MNGKKFGNMFKIFVLNSNMFYLTFIVMHVFIASLRHSTLW